MEGIRKFARGLSTLGALASGKIIVGNGSNLPAAVTPGGVASMDNAGAFFFTDTAYPSLLRKLDFVKNLPTVGWAGSKDTGTGGSWDPGYTTSPQSMLLTTGDRTSAALSAKLVSAAQMLLGMWTGYYSKDFSIFLTVARQNSKANIKFWFGIHEYAAAVADLSEKGVGIKVKNLDIYLESYGAIGRQESAALYTLSASEVRAKLELRFTAYSLYSLYVNDVLKGSISTDLPTGSGAANQQVLFAVQDSGAGAGSNAYMAITNIWVRQAA